MDGSPQVGDEQTVAFRYFNQQTNTDVDNGWLELGRKVNGLFLIW